MITPKQATQIAAQSPSPPERTSNALAAIEAAIDVRLVLDGHASLSCPSDAAAGALIAAPVMIMEIERRYRFAGWKTTFDGGTITISLPGE